jgi:hypothetical protein
MPRNSKNNSHTETDKFMWFGKSPTSTRQRKNTILNMENYEWCLHNSLTHKCSTSLIMQISLLTIGSLVLLVSLTLGVPFAAQLQLYL